MALTHEAETYRRRAVDQLRKAKKNLDRARRKAATENNSSLHADMERAGDLAESAWMAASGAGNGS